MSNIKISELNEITTLENNDILPIVDSSAIETKKMLLSQLKENIISNEYGTSDSNGYTQEYINNNVGVIESGSNANGSYIKYADGTMICYNTKQFTNIPINAAYGALYESASINLDNFPVAFIDIPIVTTSINKGTTVWVEALPNLNATSLGNTWFMKPTSSTGSTFWFSYIAIGKWK